MDKTSGENAADNLMTTAYPDERKRASAVRWLGWLAYQMRDDRHVSWKPLPSGAQDLLRLQPWPRGALALARIVIVGIMLVLGPVLAIGACILGFWHAPGTWCRWADGLPETLERGLLRRPLGYAVARRLLVQAADHYKFPDPALQATLAARYLTDRDARARQRAAKGARTGTATRLVAFLDDRGTERISNDVAAGTAVYVVTIIMADLGTGFRAEQAAPLVFLISAALFGVRAAAPTVRWAVASIPGLSRADAVTAAALAAALLAALITGSGPALAAGLAAILPASFVAACGLWACHLTRRTLARHRASGLLAYLPDAVAAVTIGVAASVLVKRSLLTTGPAAALLFPIATSGSLRAWRAMNHARRTPVSVAADLTLALLLGAELTLFAVWLANLLGLSRAEVSVLRAALEHAGGLADLPWWSWAAAYLTLAGAAVARGRWPVPRQVRALLRAAPAVTVAKRVLTGVHIGLLVIVFVAVSAPAAVTPLLRHQISTRYEVALQRELAAAQALDAYTWIRAGLAPDMPGSAVLQRIVVAILHIGHQSPGGKSIGTESDLAQRLGRLQATTLPLSSPPRSPVPSDSMPGLDGELSQLEGEEREGDAVTRRAEQIGEYLAVAIASTINIPSVSDHEVVQIVREYLNGLIEESPLKDTIAAWYRKASWLAAPLSAAEVVEPDAARLEKAAAAQLDQAIPHDQDAANALNATRDQSPEVSAAELANATRYRQEGAGPCDSTCRLATPRGTVNGPVVDRPEPVDPEVPADPFGDIPH